MWYNIIKERFLSTPSARRATHFLSFPWITAEISIHALCEEGDSRSSALNLSEMLFLSTPSARRATADTTDKSKQRMEFLSTPSARRATRTTRASESVYRNFYPRPLRGGRPEIFYARGSRGGISIHALCEEGDALFGILSVGIPKFLSTPSARRATEELTALSDKAKISIHALCEEGDSKLEAIEAATNGFLSTPSARRATTGRAFG